MSCSAEYGGTEEEPVSFQKVLVLYYSGVGGTRVVAKTLTLRLNRLPGVNADVVAVDSAFLDEANLSTYLAGYDMLVFGCPVFRMAPPKPMVDFLERLPRFPKQTKAFTFMTKSGISGDATHDLIELLVERNICPGGWIELIAPGTDMNLVVKRRVNRNPFGLFRNFASGIIDTLRGGHQANQLLNQATEQIQQILTSDDIHVVQPRLKWYMNTMWWIQERFLDPIEHRMHEIKFRKPCVSCGENCVALKCTQEAWQPAYGGPTFNKSKCVACMMCVNFCPDQVIICEQQVVAGTEDYPRLTRPFFRAARKRFFG